MRWTKLLLLLCSHGLSPPSLAQTAARYDVVMDEVLPDPSPQAGLPNAAFIEMKNVSTKE